ncbi:hypothetical protein [Chitinophaga sancti]|uniref:hypothetical protein n=1 Tax=Chitinophaga sancti TaxID=1004 RepID=UPI003F7A8F10
MKTLYPYLLAAMVLMSACRKTRYYSRSQIVPNMLTPIDANKNVAFAASFTLAWNEMKQQVGAPINNKAKAVKWMNDSPVSGDILGPKEFKRDVRIKGAEITMLVNFQRELGFDVPMQPLKEPFTFNGKAVKAFGMVDYDPEIVAETHLVYYRDEDHFVMSLDSKDKSSDIILAKGFNKGAQLHVILQQIQGAIRKGTNIKAYASLKIPVLKFQEEEHFKELEGIDFKAKGKPYKIMTARQKTLFTLDQEGARVVDSAIIEAVSTDSVEVMRPPNLVFDKPFVVLLQKKKSPFPYFMLKVENDEIMDANRE